jgi:[ribosomal protein S18]-alanine N-acetyltransferase
MDHPPRPDLVIELLSSDADLDAVAALEARCFTNPWTRDMLARELAASQTARVFVVRLRDAPVAGFCACWFVADELHVNTMVIDFPFRRQRLGSFLMRTVMLEAARQGATRATLEVRESNEAARKLYESLGFSVTARRSRYYAHPEEDALILWHEGLAKLDGARLKG